MVDDLETGRRPVLTKPNGDGAREALKVCPGVGLTRNVDPNQRGLDKSVLDHWGPVLSIWEGYASDAEIRHAGSSGGAATALALFGLEHGGMHGVLHIAARPDVPYLNHTVMSRTRAELLAATGSRYAPASPCDSLDLVENATGPCVFIGKPCDVAAASMCADQTPKLNDRLGITIAIFCAGTPSTRGTLEMIQAMGLDRNAIESVRYRGLGWPGRARVAARNGSTVEERSLSYEESWGDILEKHRPWRCRVCADHTGEFADISVGDPWYRATGPDEPGRSLIVARTERGREFIQRAIHTGHLTAEGVGSETLSASQPNLLKARGAVWGRVLACRLAGVPAPSYRGMATFSNWVKHLGTWPKAQSILGTFKRIVRKRLHRRLVVRPFESAHSARAENCPNKSARG